MTMLLEIGNALLPLLYLALLIDYGATFFLRTRTGRRNPWLAAVVAAHLALLVARAVEAGHPPVTLTREILSLLALATAAVYAGVEWASRDRRTGIFVLLLAFLFQYTSSILCSGCNPAADAPVVGPGEPGVWMRLHVVPALVAYVALAFAGIYGGLLLASQRGLRQHRFGMLFDRLPPLDLLARMTWHALLVGFVFMTISIAVAPLIFAGGDQPMTAKVVSKIVAGSAAWLVVAVAVLGRWLGRWSQARVAAIAVVGFLVVMALLVVSGLLS